MLSGEGNAGERWKTAIGLISKKATLYVPHTFFYFFFCRCFERLQRETSRNFLVTRFFGGNVVSVLVDFFVFFFFHCRSFSPWWLLSFLIFSPPLQNFHVVLPTKNGSLSLVLALCRSFSRWAALACRLLSLFLCLPLPLYSKFLDMTINLSLIV